MIWVAKFGKQPKLKEMKKLKRVMKLSKKFSMQTKFWGEKNGFSDILLLPTSSHTNI